MFDIVHNNSTIIKQVYSNVPISKNRNVPKITKWQDKYFITCVFFEYLAMKCICFKWPWTFNNEPVTLCLTLTHVHMLDTLYRHSLCWEWRNMGETLRMRLGLTKKQPSYSYLRLEPLCELHGDVHVGQTEGCVVQTVIVHSPTNFISEKKIIY